MAHQRAPKQWSLSENETITSYESWRQNLLYCLSLDTNFAAFLNDGVKWEKKTSRNPHHGLQGDGEAVPEGSRLTAAQKNTRLELMLGQIANFCPGIARNVFIKECTSLDDVWQRIRLYYGFQRSGAHFLDLASIHLHTDERPEALYQRLYAFFHDNMLTPQSDITHHGEKCSHEEDMTPTLENAIVVMWLRLLHPGLPLLVKQRYGSELRNKTLASIKPEISQALSSLLDELRSMEDSKVMRASNYIPIRRQNRISKSCVLCKTAGRRSDNHWLSECKFLPEADRKALGRVRACQDDEIPSDIEPHTEDVYFTKSPQSDPLPRDPLLDHHAPTRRVHIVPSPQMHVYYGHHPLTLTLDSGATTNMIKASTASQLHLPVKPASQAARQADGFTPLAVTGEVCICVTRGRWSFTIDALVVKELDVDILAGSPFMYDNDIALRPAKHQIVIKGTESLSYDNTVDQKCSVRRTQSFLLRAPDQQSIILPGEYMELQIPKSASSDEIWALEPRFDTSNKSQPPCWPPPQEINSVGHTVRLVNSTDEPVMIPRHSHVCQITPVECMDNKPTQTSSRSALPKCAIPPPYSAQVDVNPHGVISDNMAQQFVQVNRQFDRVFNPQIPVYNGASGDIKGSVNMGPVLPPQRKGRMPQYSSDRLNALQEKCDVLEGQGVLATPEQMGVKVEYLNISFLVNKPNGGTRMVTDFAEVGKYSKPQPSLLPDTESVLRSIGQWKYLIKTDLSQAFFQIPLDHASMKYCGIATPFKGIRVYTRCAMGMPGSESALEELLSRVLGHLVQKGIIVKIADDMYVGADSVGQLLLNWTEVLQTLADNNLGLSAPKTIICPRSTVVLGWQWSEGSLQALPHRVSALTTVSPPKSVRALRSYIGACKILCRVLQGFATKLTPLDRAVAGRQSSEQIDWSEDLLAAFKRSQAALSDCKVVTLPRPDDTLWLVTDGAVKDGGMGATLYVLRDEKLHLAGFFSGRLRKHQVPWLPCEVEALSIATSVQHFAPYILQSHHQAHVLTDSRPCVLAYQKLQRGEFSNSARVTSFLTTVSRYHVTIGHLAGTVNLPSDFASRHPVTCPDSSCQICKFVAELEVASVRSTSVQDILQGKTTMPFTSRSAWRTTQQECPDLRRVHAHLKQGTRPGKKETTIPDVKRYLQSCSISYDGLLVTRSTSPFQGSTERIVIPRSVVVGLITALHLRFTHPSAYQLKQLATRYFFALNMDDVVASVTASCPQCAALKSIPVELMSQTSTTPPDILGSHFAVDVMKRYKQLVVVLRETVSSYTMTTFIERETRQDLCEAIILLCSEIRNLGDYGAHIRVDPAPGFVSLCNDPLLQRHGIVLEVGRIKNHNKNPVAERAIQELGYELLRQSPEGGPISRLTLALATASLNARLRHSGLSAREIVTQRDQVTGEQIPVDDLMLIKNQQRNRDNNHPHSELSKSRGNPPPNPSSHNVGDLVFLKRDHDKTQARDRYLVVSVSGSWCQLRKFIKSQFRAKKYDVLMSECIPCSASPPMLQADGPSSSSMGFNDDDCSPYSGNRMMNPESVAHKTPPCSVPPAELVTLPQPLEISGDGRTLPSPAVQPDSHPQQAFDPGGLYLDNGIDQPTANGPHLNTATTGGTGSGDIPVSSMSDEPQSTLDNAVAHDPRPRRDRTLPARFRDGTYILT